jgi:predicted nuclease of predicted toxin-antitoxin system
MSRGLLLDENLPKSAKDILECDSLALSHVSDCGLRGRPDIEIWEFALAKDLVVLTKDDDFIGILTLKAQGRAIVLQVGNLRLRELREFLIRHREVIIAFVESEIPALHLS